MQLSDVAFPIVESFLSIQGEGKYTGYPAFFVRVKKCNLYPTCPVGCDTFERIQHVAEAWLHFEEITRNCKTTNHLVITGGEPSLYLDNIQKLLTYLQDNFDDELLVEVETNGYNLSGLCDLLFRYPFSFCVNFSPKVYEADKIHEMIQIAELMKFDNIDYTLKLVVWTLDAHDMLVRQLIKYGYQDHIWLMPRGATPEELEESWPVVLEIALRRRVKVSGRLHIYARTL